jgi:hypothetical protein
MSSLKALIGETLTAVEVLRNTDEGDKILFTTASGKRFKMHHYQDCCEYVRIEDVTGDVGDLVGSPILVAKESSNSSAGEDARQTWTFYKFATTKGWVDIRWLGSSNGYYSEGVSFEEEGQEKALDLIKDYDLYD